MEADSNVGQPPYAHAEAKRTRRFAQEISVEYPFSPP
jgi:hypothetical protein